MPRDGPAGASHGRNPPLNAEGSCYVRFGRELRAERDPLSFFST